MTEARSRSGYLPSLDGWRCVAILSVMYTHDVPGKIFGHRTDYYQAFGGYGLVLFFAISGILITWRILEEESRTGQFSIKAFYIRRFFRIQPAQWVYLAVAAVLIMFRLVPVTWKYWLGALFLYENFLWHNIKNADEVIRRCYLVGHFWTLAVEEHFYLAISAFFYFCRSRRVAVLGFLLAALLIVQAVATAHGLCSPVVSNRRTYWIVQYLVFASFVALLLRDPRTLALARRWFSPWVAFSLTVLAVYVHHFLVIGAHSLSPRALLFDDQTALFYSFTGWVVATMLHPRSLTTRVLELKPLRYIGRISYSLYIWHVLFYFGGKAGLSNSAWLARCGTIPVKYVLSFGFALLSYYFVEKPLIRLGHRLAPPATPGHQDLAAGSRDRSVSEVSLEGVATSA